MTDLHPRLRFAPSPTGYFHVGGARTALYNWLYARAQGGSLLLRIDDTDEARNRPEWTDGIIEALSWLEIDFDEGPVFQSQRRERYDLCAQELVEAGRAYYCQCTREEIDQRAKERNGPPGYDGFCRELGLSQGAGRALRFKVDREEVTTVSDLVRGEVRFENSSIEDFVLVKGNGAPLYVLANFVDDVDFHITHVVRAEEHLPTTPKAVMLYLARGEQVPVFAHLPVLVNESRLKLSKRRDRVAVEDFRDQGFLPEAMCNYLALLGWSPGGNREFFTRLEMLESFSFDRVGHSPAFFDVVKMTHFNKHYISVMDPARFVERAIRVLEGTTWWEPTEENVRTLGAIAPLVQERISLMAEVVEMTEFLFRAPSLETLSAQPLTAQDRTSVEMTLGLLGDVEPWEPLEIENKLRELAAERETSLRKLQAPIRIALTGRRIGPPLFESIALLGKEETRARLLAVLDQPIPEG